MTIFEAFRDLHRPGQPLLLANAWDVASARVIAADGAPAIATTSAGVAWSLGAPDGDELDREEALAVIRRVVRAVDVPVTADIERGFGASLDELAETGRLVRASGAVGVNMEDSVDGEPALRPIPEAAERIAAFRAGAGPDVFVNARVDAYLRDVSDPFAETIDRAAAYLAAGADGIFVPGLADVDVVARITARVDAPINVLVGAGSPPVRAFAEAGVARVSLGSSVASAAYGLARRAASELREAGTYTSVADAIGYGELNELSR